MLAAGSQDGFVTVWDLNMDTEQKFNLSEIVDSITSLAFSPDMKTLAAGSSDLKIVFIDLQAWLPLTETLNGAPGSILSLSYSPDGNYLYSGHADGSILQWEASSQLLIEKACQAAERNMTLDEWQRFFPGLPYQETCSL